jgi:LysM repeat protein
MKRISFILLAIGFCAASTLRAQDAATEERLNKLSGQIEDLLAGQKAFHKQIEALGRELEGLREQANKPNTSYAGQDDLKKLREAILEVDRKRIEDAELVKQQLKDLAKTLKSVPVASAPASNSHPKTTTASKDETAAKDDKPAKDDKGYPYTIQSGDTLSVIVQAYREKNIKITTDQILKANPGLKAERLKVGQKIWIPAPQT